jgi:hypothetical protein
MSRSLSGQCAKYQTAFSQIPSEGSSLRLEMIENELEFDNCPMRFDDGRDPYANPAVMEVFSGSNRLSPIKWRTLLVSLLSAMVSLWACRI